MKRSVITNVEMVALVCYLFDANVIDTPITTQEAA